MDGSRDHEMARRGRIGAWRLFATHDAREVTAPARRAFDSRFYDGIPKDLSPEERERRAMYARRAYFASISVRGVEARQRRAPARHGRPGTGRANPPTQSPGPLA